MALMSLKAQFTFTFRDSGSVTEFSEVGFRLAFTSCVICNQSWLRNLCVPSKTWWVLAYLTKARITATQATEDNPTEAALNDTSIGRLGVYLGSTITYIMFYLIDTQIVKKKPISTAVTAIFNSLLNKPTYTLKLPNDR